LTMMNMTLEEANAKFSTRQASFRVFIEEAKTRDEAGQPVFVPQSSDIPASPSIEKEKPILIFFKHFDAEKQELKGAGYSYMNPSDRVQDLAEPILQIMNWPPGEGLKLFEVSQWLLFHRSGVSLTPLARKSSTTTLTR